MARSTSEYPGNPGKRVPRRPPARPGRHREGLILPFTMFVLVLVSLMGVVILANSRSEVRVTGSARVNRETFNSAESSAQVALLMARILVRPELGSPEAVLARGGAARFPLTVDINRSRFNLSQIMADSNGRSHVDRYLETGWAHPGAARKPHLTFSLNNGEVAAAVVSVDTRMPIQAGSSLGVGDAYDSSATSPRHLIIIVSVRGRPQVHHGLPGQEPSSMITAMFREMM